MFGLGFLSGGGENNLLSVITQSLEKLADLWETLDQREVILLEKLGAISVQFFTEALSLPR